jgi:hypothetical protein
MNKPTSTPPSPPQHPVSHWFAVAGFIVGAVTLLFLMGLVMATVIGLTVPQSGRFPVVAVLALGAAMSVAFIGGNAAAKGKIPLADIGETPIEFSVTGGIAVLVIALAFGYYFYVRASPADATSAVVAGPADTLVNGTVVLVSKDSKVIPWVLPKSAVVTVMAEGVKDPAKVDQYGRFQLTVHEQPPARPRFTVLLNGKPVCVANETLGESITLPIQQQEITGR